MRRRQRRTVILTTEDRVIAVHRTVRNKPERACEMLGKALRTGTP